MSEKKLLQLTPTEFVRFLNDEKISRFYFVYDKENRKVKTSHHALQEIAEFLENDKRDFEEHEGIFVQLSLKYDTLLGAFVHRTNRGQAAGGVRYWDYDNMEDYLRDGMRLAKGMTHKNALAGLWWGGGKGVMAHNPSVEKNDPAVREFLYKEYGKFMTSLKGCYVTAEDVGTSVEDMANIFSNTRFTTCIPYSVGGSGNPSIPTARGVIAGMEAAMDYLNGETLEGKTIAIQGLGHVAQPMIKFLFDKNIGKIVACDIFPEAVENAKKEFENKNLEVRLVNKNDNSILFEECDILAPCATGGILNSETIQSIKAKIICGAANNQLEDPIADDERLFERNIIYVPDFLTNRMGIVNCADEQAGFVNNDPIIEKHLSKDWEYSIHKTTLRVLERSKAAKIPPGKVAVELADKLSRELNPIYGHRSQLIINSLVESHWENLG
ncbi:Branched-chain amino acid dehydrogenase [deaminating] [hydrothermal vent metagenome]|uniref:Branched-chain amino acid dehydrogenase [deaminating] n=1 Tax=hydrothermal vent metagenome TaxID=652676 RepID=A0A3B1C914_9ZZZZ